MRVLGLVTARGGSKGFPGKNLAPLAGRPLVAWAWRTLTRLRERHPELVLHLSTDSPDIAAAWPVGERPAGLRPAELARDDTSSIAVVEHELAAFATAGQPCDAVLLLQPTSPLTGVEELDAAWAAFAAGADSVIGVAPATHPVQWAFHRDGGGVLEAVLDFREQRRQSFRPAFYPVGFYLARSDFLRQHRAFSVPGLTTSVVVPQTAAVDIDHPVDLDLAQAVLHRASGERPFTLGKHQVGGPAPCLVIAEAGVNHNGEIDLALDLVRAAAAAGADVVKFQSFHAEALVTAQARTAAYQQGATGATEQLAMLRRLELDAVAMGRLQAECVRLGVGFLSTPFDHRSADELHRLDVPAFKVGSGDLTNHPFLAHLAGLGRPLIVSTGMATLDEVEDAAACIRAHGDPPVAWLHCVSAYPAPVAASNLRAVDSLRLTVGGPVGLSDHTPGLEVALAAVARGAQVIEKHLTLDRSLAGPDHAASLEPGAFAQLVRQIRAVESALGDGIKRPQACEGDTAAVARRSLVAARNLPVGHRLAVGDLLAKRPGSGIAPDRLGAVLGKTLTKPLDADALLAWKDLA